VAAHLTGAGWLVAFALWREARPFRRRFPSVPFVVTGVGAPNFVRVLARRRPEGVIAAGFAGALRPGLRVGDVVIANAVVDSISGRRFAPAQPRATATSRAGAGRLVFVNQVVGDPMAKRDLGVRWSADACDMESAIIARACDDADIPYVCVRVVSDEVNAALSPELATCFAGGRIRPAAVLRCIVSHPGEMWRLARDTRRAAERLATVVGLLSARGASDGFTPLCR
jgi:hypothetical protein